MFRFTIRDVLWLTVVVALAMGWWLDRTRLAVSLGDVQGEYSMLQARYILLERAYEEAQEFRKLEKRSWLGGVEFSHALPPPRAADSLGRPVADDLGQFSPCSMAAPASANY